MKISIDRAIEILNPEHREHYDGLDEVNEACRMGMEALKRQRWIPVNERLPKNFMNVLIWDKIDGDTFTGHYSKYDGWTIDGWEDADEPFEITHWMPLPEPPEKGGKENAAD